MSTIYKRGGVYWLTGYKGGRRVRIPVGTDKRIAEQKRAEFDLTSSAIKYGYAPRNISWKSFKDGYLAKVKSLKAKATYVHESIAIRLLEEYRPIQRLEQITPALLDELRVAWKEQGYSHAIINRRIGALKTMMRKAEADKLILPQEWKSVKKFKTPKGRLLFWTMDDLKKLIKVCHGPWLTLCLLGARAGLRRGEICYLDWSDIDFDRSRIHVTPKKDWAPKDFERRFIPMSDDLREHLTRLKPDAKLPWVFADGDHRETMGSASTYFKRLVKKAGLRGSVHTLRHTFASHLAMAGVPLYTISKLLGHSSVQVTEIYAHLQPETYESALKALPKL